MRWLLRTEREIPGLSEPVDTQSDGVGTPCGDDVEIAGDGEPDRAHLLGIIAEEHRPPPPDRPWVLVNMVASADGASAGTEGRSASLSGPADRALFHALRGIADVILAGAGTVRAENYGPPRPVPGAEALRAARRQAPLPRIAVVSGSLHLDPRARLFEATDADTRPILLTTADALAAAAPHARELGSVADLHPVGTNTVDWDQALRLLRERYGTRTLVVEGGPIVNAQLLAADLVDELCLTIAPSLLGGGAQRIVAAVPTIDPRSLQLARVLEDQSFLLLRYVRTHSA